jgi:hypothetical protein
MGVKMGWDGIATVGGHKVYDVLGHGTVVGGQGMIDRIVIGNRCWQRPWSEGMRAALANGSLVTAFVPIGGLSGQDKSTVVRLPDGSVEVWQRTLKKVKEDDDGDD